MKRQFRICHSKKSDGKIDLTSKANCGNWLDNREFKHPDSNGDIDLEQAWKRECYSLNEKHPNLNHWVEHRYV